MVVDASGTRLAKRHGAVTLSDLERAGRGVDAVRAELAVSLGLLEPGERDGGPVTMRDLLERFDPYRVPADDWVWPG